MIGTRLGSYEITAKLGEGGMGEVYRASDSRLKREVAIKVLPPAFTEDKERLARFDREAQLLAQLHHPNIASIFGLEESDGTRALVMELVEGPTLAERLAAGPISFAESMSIALQIALALEEAHEKGIVHRDLKPQNVKASIEGRVKVLDFGLAKAMDPASAAPGTGSVAQLAASPTLTLGATQMGVILGTAAYMAPEQAKGASVDKRADIWAFGVVLYEMLTGDRLFEAPTVPETLAQVLTRAPDLESLPAATPSAIRKLLRRCLERNPKERLRDIGEARVVLETLVSGRVEDDRPSSAPSRRSAALVLFAGAALGALAALGVVGLLGRAEPRTAPGPTTRFRIETPAIITATQNVRISPDGRSVAWSDPKALWVRRLDQLEPRRVELPWSASMSCWTGDGRSLVVVRSSRGRSELWAVPLEGGEPRPIGALPEAGFLWGVSPGEGDDLLLGMADAGLFTMPLAGGAAKSLLAAADGESLVAPVWLPERRALLFADAARGRIEALVDGRRKVVLERDGDRLFDPLFARPGHLLFRIGGGRSARGIWAVRFSPERLEAEGEPVRILPYGMASVSRGGTIAFREFVSDMEPDRLVEVDRDGRIVTTIGEPLPGISDPALSPDGSQVAVSAMADEQNRDLFVFDRQSGGRYPLRDDFGSDLRPFWRRGGTTLGFLTYAAGARQARERDVDGSGEARLLQKRTLVASESPDGSSLILSFYETIAQERSQEPRKLFDGGINWASFSPDGRWIAYSSRQTPGIFMRRFPSGEGLTPVTSQDSAGAHFGANGRELFLWQGDSLVSIDLDLAGDVPRIGKASVLFAAAAARFDTRSSFDLTPEGRFLLVQRVEGEAQDEKDPGIVVVENWASELASATSTGERSP